MENIPQRTELLSGGQRGHQVILSWPAPRRNAKDASVQSIRRIDVFRLAEPVGAPRPLTEEEFGASATLIGAVSFETIRSARDTLTYTDTLELTAPVRLRYAIRYVNAAGQPAAFSNFLLVQPAARVSQPPVLPQPPDVSQTAITIRWEAPAANVDGSIPPNILGYNVYRTDRAGPASTPLNPAPLTTTTYHDQTFKFGEEYIYLVRAVSLGIGDAPQIESLNSNPVSVQPRDLFPPAPPTGISANPSQGRISIFFATNHAETDVVGYHIYRSTQADLPKEGWTKLTPQLLERTTFHDETVEAGVTYFYYVLAIDSAGNQSVPSEVVSETAL